jgi:hypothetical protein
LLSGVAGGSLPPRIYFVQLTYIISAVETAAGPEASIALNKGELLNVASPIVGANSPSSYSVYVGTSSGGERRQASGIALGTAWTEPISGLVSGPAPTAETAANVLPFKYPPRNLPAFDYAAVRHDNIATSGIREAIFERRDRMFGFDMPFTALGSDVGLWSRFFDYALQGFPFSFYPDSTLNARIVYWLESTTWTAAYKQIGMTSFKTVFRQVQP